VVKSNLTNPSVRLSLIGRGPHKPHFIGIISGLCGVARYCCFDNTIHNAYTAIMERVFYHVTAVGFVRPHVPNMETVNLVLSEFRVAFVALIERTVPVPLSVYPENNYKGRKLLVYKKARDHVMGRTYGRNFGALKTFIKHEKILVKEKRLVPRVIQPRSPEYNVCVGRYIRQLEHKVYSVIDRLWGGPTVMKGLNCVQQGQVIASAWYSFSNPVAIMLDAVRFDQHVSVPMLSWEHGIYLEHFPVCFRPELEWLLSMQLFNRGKINCHDGSLTYHVNGCRASGDMNTAMGNVLIMCASMWSLCKKHHVKARLINNGDDCCLIVDRASIGIINTNISAFYQTLGFVIEIEGCVSMLEQIQFCQTHPIRVGLDWVMVRDPKVAISKDVTILKNWSPKEYGVYLRELGRAGLAAYADLPVWGAFYRCLSRSQVTGPVSSRLVQHVSVPILDSGLGRLTRGVQRGGPVLDSTRTSFALAFGLIPQVQRHLESYYGSMDPGPRCVFPGPAESLLF